MDVAAPYVNMFSEDCLICSLRYDVTFVENSNYNELVLMFYEEGQYNFFSKMDYVSFIHPALSAAQKYRR